MNWQWLLGQVFDSNAPLSKRERRNRIPAWFQWRRAQILLWLSNHGIRRRISDEEMKRKQWTPKDMF